MHAGKEYGTITATMVILSGPWHLLTILRKKSFAASAVAVTLKAATVRVNDKNSLPAETGAADSF